MWRAGSPARACWADRQTITCKIAMHGRRGLVRQPWHSVSSALVSPGVPGWILSPPLDCPENKWRAQPAQQEACGSFTGSNEENRLVPSTKRLTTADNPVQRCLVLYAAAGPAGSVTGSGMLLSTSLWPMWPTSCGATRKTMLSSGWMACALDGSSSTCATMGPRRGDRNRSTQ